MLSKWNPYSGVSPSFDTNLIFGVKDGFDIVIGNPPYIQIKGIPWNDRKYFEAKFEFATGRFNVFYLFMEKSVSYTKKNALSAFIIPDRLMLNTQCQNLRNWLLEKQTIKEMSSFDESVFETAVVDSVIIIYKNTINTDDVILCKNRVSISNISLCTSQEVPRSNFLNSPSMQFNLSYDPRKNSLIDKIRRVSVELGKIAQIKDGIIQSKIADVLFLSKKENQFCQKLLFGKNINKFEIVYDNNWVNYKIDEMKLIEAERNGNGLRLRNKEIFEREKILTRQTADRIIAALDEDNYYYANTLHGTTITNDNFDVFYVLGILNSKLMTWYYRTITAEEGKVFAQVKIALLKLLPIPNIEREQQQEIVNIVKAITADNGNKLAYMSEIDDLVYKAYQLNDYDIEVIENYFKISAPKNNISSSPI